MSSNHFHQNRHRKTSGLTIAIIIGAMVILALVVYGAFRFFSRSTMPEAYPVASGDGTEMEGAGSITGGETVDEITPSGESETASKTGATGDTQEDSASTDVATVGMTDIEYSPEYLAVIQNAEDRLGRMSIEEKVAQLFFVSIDALTEVGNTTVAGDVTRAKLQTYPVGGIILFGKNITDPDQVTALTNGLKSISSENDGIPVMIGVDEEGGTVVRIGGRDSFPEQNIGAMMNIGDSGDPERAKEAGRTIGAYLKKYGFDIDFAPSEDVFTNPENTVIGTRAFGTTPERVTLMSEAFRKGLEEQGVQSCIKHYPGHGDTQADSHFGLAVTNKTLDELKSCELIPFQESIRAGADLVMASHISAPNVTGDMTPASLSDVMVTEILRGQMGYDNVVVTDDLSMKAIMDQYSPAQACVKSIQAGVDWVMVTSGFTEAYNGVLDAVNKNEITVERLDESVKRILILKYLNE